MTQEEKGMREDIINERKVIREELKEFGLIMMTKDSIDYAVLLYKLLNIQPKMKNNTIIEEIALRALKIKKTPRIYLKTIFEATKQIDPTIFNLDFFKIPTLKLFITKNIKKKPIEDYYSPLFLTELTCLLYKEEKLINFKEEFQLFIEMAEVSEKNILLDYIFHPDFGNAQMSLFSIDELLYLFSGDIKKKEFIEGDSKDYIWNYIRLIEKYGNESQKQQFKENLEFLSAYNTRLKEYISSFTIKDFNNELKKYNPFNLKPLKKKEKWW